MDAEQKAARRAKRILGTLVLICILGSAVILFKVLVGGLSTENRSNPPATYKDASELDDKTVFAAYAGSASCRGCHQKEFDAWSGSHHALAERPVDAAKDGPAFEPSRGIQHGSQSSEARSTNGTFEIVTIGLDRQRDAFKPERVIGVDPLRQFLIPAPGGRFQSTELAYDPNRNEWFDVYGNEDRRPGEWGHWTGRGMTWNSMCAACHNTRLRKHYESTSDAYKTTEAEMAVGCEACHGGMAEHNRWQQAHPDQKHDPTIKLLSRDQMFDVCGSCHSRRAELTGEFKPGDAFFDHYSLTIPDETETFYPDGQIHEEDYEFTSFLGSRMYSAGVRCVDCHEPHSGKTRLAGNALCLSCHGAPVPPAPKIDASAHSHHKAGEAGDACVACHMPVTTYMQRHPRHDHGFTTPDPLLTKQFGIPNACGRCHTNQPIEWAIAQTEAWYGTKLDRPSRARARTTARARRRDQKASAELLALLKSETNALWRASMALLLKNWAGNTNVFQALQASLADPHPLVRSSAIRSLEGLADSESAQLHSALQNRLADPIAGVRIDAAWALRATLDTNAPAGRDLMRELAHNCDQPGGALQLGVFLLGRGDIDPSLNWLARAVQWDTNSAGLHHEYAIGLSRAGRSAEAVRELQIACQLAPRDAEYRFNLGLAFSEVGEPKRAGEALQEAVNLDPQFARAWYNLGLARNSEGDTEAALSALIRAESIDPTSAVIPYARATILARLGRTVEARAATRRALELQPGFAEAKQLLETLDSTR